MPVTLAEIERRLWASADRLRANSGLRAAEYSVPLLGLIFLRFADYRFARAEAELARALPPGSRRSIDRSDYQARGMLYVPAAARFAHLLRLPEDADIARAINDAMRAIEAENPDLKDVLPKTYSRVEKDTLLALLKTFSAIPPALRLDVLAAQPPVRGAGSATGSSEAARAPLMADFVALRAVASRDGLPAPEVWVLLRRRPRARPIRRR